MLLPEQIAAARAGRRGGGGVRSARCGVGGRRRKLSRRRRRSVLRLPSGRGLGRGLHSSAFSAQPEPETKTTVNNPECSLTPPNSPKIIPQPTRYPTESA
jgi:hypothetical protein